MILKNDSLRYFLLGCFLAITVLFSCRTGKSDLNNIVRLTVEDNSGGGTGFEVVTASGHVYTVTNRHMCEDKATYAEVGTRRIPLRIIEISKDTDLCLLEGIVGYEGLPLAAHDPDIDSVIDIYGYGQLQGLTHTQGFWVGDVQYELAAALKFMGVPNGKYATATVLPGNSGSPVFNSSREVVGVVFATGAPINFRALIIPLDDLKQFLKAY